MNQPLKFNEIMQPVSEASRLESQDYHVWGASLTVDIDGLYHLFYSRWPVKNGFEAWVTHSEIAHATSPSPEGPFTHVDVALPPRMGQYWDAHVTHNPTIKKFAGKYYLYYMGTRGAEPPEDICVRDFDWDGEVTNREFNFEFRNNQRIGVAVADHPNGPWQRFDQPLIDVSHDPSQTDSLCCNNPSIVQRPDGTFLMLYKAVGQEFPLPFGGPVVLRTATAKGPTGPFTKQPLPVFTKDGVKFPVEDPFLWYQADRQRYFALVKDLRGTFTKCGASLALFESKDGLDWGPATHCLGSEFIIPWKNGPQRVDRFERPQIYLEDGIPKYIFLAIRLGEGKAFNVHVPLKYC